MDDKRYVRPLRRPPAQDERKRWEVVAISLKDMLQIDQKEAIEEYMNDGWSWLGCNNNYIYMTKYLGR